MKYVKIIYLFLLFILIFWITGYIADWYINTYAAIVNPPPSFYQPTDKLTFINFINTLIGLLRLTICTIVCCTAVIIYALKNIEKKD